MVVHVVGPSQDTRSRATWSGEERARQPRMTPREHCDEFKPWNCPNTNSIGGAVAYEYNDYDIRELARNGSIAREARGVYRVNGAPDGGGDGSELALLFSLVPGAVLCLESAMAWHDLTTNTPRSHWPRAAAGGPRSGLSQRPTGEGLLLLSLSALARHRGG